MEQKTYSMQEESPLMSLNSLELETSAMRVKLQQNRQALEEQGIQSASDKLRQLQGQQ
jgi:hypothetical protein